MKNSLSNSCRVFLNLALTPLFIGALTAAAHAAPITIPGSTFSPATGDNIPGFTRAGNIGSGNYTAGTAGIYGNGNGDGGTETSGDLLATLGEIQANTTYTYSINIGGADSNAGNYAYIENGIGEMALVAGSGSSSTLVPGATFSLTYTPAPYNSSTSAPTFTTETLSFDTANTANLGLVGQSLEVQFGLAAGSGAGGLGYPNVYFQSPTLDATSDALAVTPEPSTWALMLVGMSLLIFVQRKRFSKV